MAPTTRPATGSPSTRAALARERINLLPDNEIVYVDRLGPRILAVPPIPVRLSRETLRELNKGNFTGRLGQGARFLSKWMLQCPEITINTSGNYAVQKKKSNPNEPESSTFTVNTLDVWTGKPGTPHDDRSIEDLIFYSIGPDLLPSYHSWKDDKLERREGSLESESQTERRVSQAPKPIGEMIDEYKAKQKAQMDEDASNDPENLLRFKPDIIPSDPAWEGVEEYFKWILQYERDESPESPQILQILQDELLESQRLLAVPALNSGYRAKIQDQNTEEYREALRTTFLDKPDNLATKLTMLCFGLPIEPLTIKNVQFAGGAGDLPVVDDENATKQGNGQIIERIVKSEKPLEFLDGYNERSYGYPILRAQKRKYQEADSETIKTLLAETEARAKHPRLIWDECGLPEVDDSGQDLHLRGGTGDAERAPSRTYLLYTDMGHFTMSVAEPWGAFYTLTHRLFHLKTAENWGCQIDLVPVLLTDSGTVSHSTEGTMYMAWDSRTKYDNQPRLYELWLARVIGSNDMLNIRVRLNSHHPDPLSPGDPLEPENSRAVVNLEVANVGVAYWFLPSQPRGVNMRQDTFRNAVECLIPQHRQHRVEWLIEGEKGEASSSGRLLLIAEAPSMALWNRTQEVLASRDRVTIHLTVLAEEAVPPNPLAVKMLMPGFRQIGSFDRLPDVDLSRSNLKIFNDIRTFVRQRTQPNRTAVRIWAGMEHYDDLDNLNPNKTLSMVLPAEHDIDVEEDIWQSEFLAMTWDAVVVKPNFDSYRITCLSNQTTKNVAHDKFPSENLGVFNGNLTLQRFRSCVIRLTGDYNPELHHISIEQAQSGDTFLVGPGMTERQWQTQVFDWLDSPNIMFRHVGGWEITYAQELIDGPLGPTHNGTPPRPQVQLLYPHGARTLPRARTPPLDEQPLVTTHPKKRANPPNKASKKKKLAQAPAQEPASAPVTTGMLLKPAPLLQSQQPEGAPTTPSTGQPTGVAVIGQGIAPAGNKPLDGVLPAQKTLAVRYEDYRKEQARLEALRAEAYQRDQSIHQGGQGPQIPMFGPSIEGHIPVAGPRFPTVYTKLSTATENVERDIELDALRKTAIDRLDFCGICQRPLPAGAHNLVERERHFQNHRDVEAEARRNGFDRNLRVAQALLPEVFYCEYCGMASNQFEDENSGMQHGPSCAQKATVHDVPHYCQYCRLDFWDNDIADETVRSHLRNCANERRVSPQGQISLYQQLLSRAVDSEQPNGDSSCHFEGCHEIFNLATTNVERANHFFQHIDRNDNARRCNDRCPFEGCNTDLTGMPEDDMIVHLQEHIGWDEDDICLIPDCGMQLERLTAMEVIAHLREHIMDETISSLQCPFGGCNNSLENLTQQQISSHFNLHFASNRRRCPVWNCGQDLTGFTDQQLLTHFNLHIGSNPRQCPFPTCGQDFEASTDDQFRTHLNIHFIAETRRCPFRSCEFDFGNLVGPEDKMHINRHLFADDATQRDREQHLLVHMLRCQWPHCNHTFRDEDNNESLRRHYRGHAATSFGDADIIDQSLGDQRCQWPGCWHVFNEDATDRARESHFDAHVPLRCPIEGCRHVFVRNATGNDRAVHIQEHLTVIPCFYPGCNVQFDQNNTNAEFVDAHLRAHYEENNAPPESVMNRQCHWPDCEVEFHQNSTVDDIAQHFRTHLPYQCPFPECSHVFSQSTTEEQKRIHMHAHCSQDCQWPGCGNIYVAEPSDGEIIQHMLAHARAHGVQPGTQRPPAQGPDVQGQDPPGQNPIGQGPAEQGPPEEDQDNIPQYLRARYPGREFYCPTCFYKVSGGNASACRRHRGPPCNVIGHDHWRIGTEADRKQWKASVAGQVAPARGTPRRRAPRNVVADPAYRPRPEVEDPDDEADDGGIQILGRGTRRSGRKRPRPSMPREEVDDDEDIVELERNGNPVGPSSKRQRQ